MPGQNLKVVAIIETTEEQTSKVQEALSYCALESRRESGCISYDVTLDRDNAAKFVVLEVWKDEEVLTEHMSKGHFLKLKELLSLVGAKIDIMMLDSLDD